MHQCMKVHQSVWYSLHHCEAPRRHSSRSIPPGVERIGVFWSCAPVLRKEAGRITLEYSRQGGKCLYSQHSVGEAGRLPQVQGQTALHDKFHAEIAPRRAQESSDRRSQGVRATAFEVCFIAVRIWSQRALLRSALQAPSHLGVERAGWKLGS